MHLPVFFWVHYLKQVLHSLCIAECHSEPQWDVLAQPVQLCISLLLGFIYSQSVRLFIDLDFSIAEHHSIHHSHHHHQPQPEHLCHP